MGNSPAHMLFVFSIVSQDCNIVQCLKFRFGWSLLIRSENIGEVDTAVEAQHHINYLELKVLSGVIKDKHYFSAF